MAWARAESNMFCLMMAKEFPFSSPAYQHPLPQRIFYRLLTLIGMLLHYAQYGRHIVPLCSYRGLTGCTTQSHVRAISSMISPPVEPAAKRRRIEPIARVSVGTVQPKSAVKAKPAKQPAAADNGDVWLIVGLGNPGPRYEKTRHNVGFLVVDTLARSAGIDMRKLEKSAAVGRGELHGKKVILAKPVTFMNNSGESVAALARYYKVPSQRVLVIADDLDQPTAAVRLRQQGGHGGHNGLRSIIQHLGGSQDFPRLKIGIGRPTGQLDVATYVLQEFRRAEMEAIDKAIEESLRIVDSCLALGLQKALSGQRL